jgi:hypothetical protein
MIEHYSKMIDRISRMTDDWKMIVHCSKMNDKILRMTDKITK